MFDHRGRCLCILARKSLLSLVGSFSEQNESGLWYWKRILPIDFIDVNTLRRFVNLFFLSLSPILSSLFIPGAIEWQQQPFSVVVFTSDFSSTSMQRVSQVEPYHIYGVCGDWCRSQELMFPESWAVSDIKTKLGLSRNISSFPRLFPNLVFLTA